MDTILPSDDDGPRELLLPSDTMRAPRSRELLQSSRAPSTAGRLKHKTRGLSYILATIAGA
eukprot:8581633-Prorocentrum_lima.AAC.1